MASYSMAAAGALQHDGGPAQQHPPPPPAVSPPPPASTAGAPAAALGSAVGLSARRVVELCRHIETAEPSHISFLHRYLSSRLGDPRCSDVEDNANDADWLDGRLVSDSAPHRTCELLLRHLPLLSADNDEAAEAFGRLIARVVKATLALERDGAPDSSAASMEAVLLCVELVKFALIHPGMASSATQVRAHLEPLQAIIRAAARRRQARSRKPARAAPPVPPPSLGGAGSMPVPDVTVRPAGGALSPVPSSHSNGTGESPAVPMRHSSMSPARPQSLPPPLKSRRFSQESFTKVKGWLKTLRLHKYCQLFEDMSYQEMVSLSSEDLVRLGVSAKGARTKMLKSIEQLRQRNQEAPQHLAKISQEIEPGKFAAVIQELQLMLQIPSPHEDESLVERSYVDNFLSVIGKAFTSLIVARVGGSETSPGDLEAFGALLDTAIRHEMFDVGQRKQLFSWKNDCQKVVDQFAGGVSQHSPIVGNNRWSLNDPTHFRADDPRMAQAGPRQKSPGTPSKQRRRQGFESRTRQRAPQPGLAPPGGPPHRSMPHLGPRSGEHLEPWNRGRGGSYGSNTLGDMFHGGHGPPSRTHSSEQLDSYYRSPPQQQQAAQHHQAYLQTASTSSLNMLPSSTTAVNFAEQSGVWSPEGLSPSHFPAGGRTFHGSLETMESSNSSDGPVLGERRSRSLHGPPRASGSPAAVAAAHAPRPPVGMVTPPQQEYTEETQQIMDSLALSVTEHALQEMNNNKRQTANF